MASPFTKDETARIVQAMDTVIASAKRQQNTAKQPSIQAVYEQEQKILEALKAKINDLK